MIAGKYAQLMANPAASMALGGGIAAGASLLGNQDEDKSTGRQALEALGAGALGVGVGAMLPRIAKGAAQRATAAGRNFTDEMQGVQSPMGQRERATAQARATGARGLMDAGVSQEDVAKAAAMGIRGTQALTNTAAALGGLGLATGLGGMVGGGVANIGNMAGLGIDPESPGSSNTSNSRISMQGGGYMQSMAEDIGAMRERSDRREQERNLQNIGTAAIGVGALGALGLSARNRLR